jgi:hypothetical protein
MNNSLATRVATVATTVVGLLLVTAGQAVAMRPIPDPGGQAAPKPTTTTTQVHSVVDASLSTLQWVLFVAAIVIALAVGAGLMHLAERRAHRSQFA